METLLKKSVSEAQFFELLARMEELGVKSHLIEYQNGVIIPTHSSAPFELESLEQLLQSLTGETLTASLPMPSSNHVTIIGNLHFFLREVIKTKTLPYRVFPDGLHLFVAPQSYRVPDTVLSARPAEFNAKDQLMNPLVIFEVASPSTFKKDQGEKLLLYTSLESLQAYVLISQDEKLVQRYLRKDGSWQYDYFIGEEETLSLADLAIQIPVSMLYEDVDFSKS